MSGKLQQLATPRSIPVAIALAMAGALQAWSAPAIVIPDSVDLGQLVSIDVPLESGDKIDWALKGINYRVFSHNVDGAAFSSLVFASGCDSTTVDGLLLVINHEQRTHRIELFEIRIGPKPDPKPDPPTGFKAQIAAAAQLIPSEHRQHTKTLASIYRSLAAEAAANPTSWDAATLWNEKKQRPLSPKYEFPSSSLAAFREYWAAEAKAVIGLNLSKTDLAGHIKALNDIGGVLDQ